MIKILALALLLISFSQANEPNRDEAKIIEMMQKGLNASKELGFDENAGKEMTKEQSQAMQNTMQSAMMSEEDIVNIEKKKMLKGMKRLPKMKKCFKKANSVDDANNCEKIMGEDAMLHTKWDESIKASTLNQIDTFEKSIPCIKKANSFNGMQRCFTNQ